MKPLPLLFILGVILSGCGPEPLADCEKGLCEQRWALELDSAVARCEARVQTQPTDSNALLGLAEAYIQKASFTINQTDTRADFWLSSNLKKIDHLLDEAITLCDKVLQQKQDSSTAYQLKGKSFRWKMALEHWGTEKALSLYDQSVSNLDKASRLKPNSAEIWFDRGLALYEYWYGWREAKSSFNKAVELDPNYRAFTPFQERRYRWSTSKLLSNEIALRNTDITRRLANALWFDRGEYLEDIRLVPNAAKAPLVLGIYFFVNDYGETGAWFYEELLRTKHHYFKDHLALAVSYQSQRRAETQNALEHFKIWARADNGMSTGSYSSWWPGRELSAKASKAYPTSPWAWIISGRDASVDTAIAGFKRAIELDSSVALPSYLIAVSYVEKKDWSNAERWLAQTIRKASSDEFVLLNAHILSALVSASTGKTSQVLREAELALKMDSAYAAYAMSEGIYGREEWSHPWFLLDKPIGPESLRSPSDRKLASLLNLWSGWSYYRRGYSAWDRKFIPLFRKSIELDPENVEAYIAMASMYTDFVLKDEKGVALLQNALRRFPGKARLHMELGKLYLNSNMSDKAQQEFERAYQMGDYEGQVMLDQLQKWRAEQKKQ